MSDITNLKYEQINWGWLNDYTGNKFAPITFYDNLYTKDGKSFAKVYEQTIEDIKSGEIVAGSAQKLVSVDEDGNATSLNIGSQSHPSYFENGIPKQCAERLDTDIAGSVYRKVKEDGQTKIPNVGEIVNIRANTLSPLDDGKLEITSTKITNTGNIANTGKLTTGSLTLTTPITLSWTNDATGSMSFNGTSASANLTLKDSGVTAARYGPGGSTAVTATSGGTLAHSGTFIIPRITVDAKGRITKGENIEYTLPEGNKVSIKQTTDTSTKRYVLVNSAQGTEATDNELKYYEGIYIGFDEKNSNEPVLMGAAWNDYAEFRKQVKTIPAGYCVASNNNGQVYKTTEKFQACDGIVSDTFGFAIGKTDEYQTPLAVSGRVLAYCHGNRENYNAGDTVCAGPEGKVYKMTREEIKEYPDRIVGIVSEIPDYEKWNSKDIDNRIWIKVK